MNPASFSPHLRALIDFWNAEGTRSADEAAAFLEMSTAEQQTTAVGYGVLLRILNMAHADLDNDPPNAFKLTRLVVDRAEYVNVPDGCEHVRRLLCGRAWKEHANALFTLGRIEEASSAARRAVQSLADDVVEQHSAVLLEAKIAADREQFDEATKLLRKCQDVFAAHDETQRLLQALNMESVILIRSRQPMKAFEVLLAARTQADELGDRRELARILNNLGHCAIELQDERGGEEFLVSALRAFDQEGMTAERQRPLWGIVDLIRKRGDVYGAIGLLQTIRREFLTRGMVLEAARVGVDLIELLDAVGATPHVVQLAQELVQVFANAGVERQLRIALAYLTAPKLREPIPPLPQRIGHVRAFLDQLTADPQSVFSAG